MCTFSESQTERQTATDKDKVEACRIILDNQDKFATEDRVLESIGRVLEAVAKSQIQEEVAKVRDI